MIAILDQPDSIKKARKIARAVVAGEIPPNLGCGLIAEVGERLRFPKELGPFLHLGHLQHDHEGLGFTAEGLVPEILEECQKLGFPND